ncbi:MAG: YIP1 family protein [Acidobacteria bacterium]|nr:YIP1 family protein [Acidobacteriota bacterium]MCA1643598.1 YIP1 family protein [Acidobacteriota bacterium]
MSTPETLTGIFFEPGRTFEALRARPRFLVAGVILAVALLVFTTLLFQKVDYDQMVRQAVESSPQAEQMSPEQREAAISMQTKPVFKALNYVSPLIGVPIFLALGGLIYMLGTVVMGKKIGYKQAVSVWAYSGLPPAILGTLANLILLFVRPPDAADAAAAARGGLVHANLGILFDRATQPLLVTLFGALDLFSIYGLVLAAIGLRKVGRLSTGAAWTIVIAVWLVGVLFRVGIAALTKQAIG